MKILLTGATGYIGRRLLPALLDKGHDVVCVVRDKGRLDIKRYKPDQVIVVEAESRARLRRPKGASTVLQPSRSAFAAESLVVALGRWSPIDLQ